MSLRASEIVEALAEILPLVRGQRIQQIYQQDLYTLLFRTRSRVLLLSVHPLASRVSLLPSLPPRVPVLGFAQLLRHRLRSKRILRLQQLGDDRAVELLLDDPSQELSLVAELTGQHGNIFLLEHRRVISSLLPNRSERRDNTPGSFYVPLLPLATQEHRPSRFHDHPDGVNEAIRQHYDHLLANQRRIELLAKVARPLRSSLQHLRRLLSKLRQDEARHRQHLSSRRWGELLLAQLNAVPSGADHVSLPDLFAEPGSASGRLEIPLDPRLTAVQNATRYLRQAAKARRGLDSISERLRGVIDEIARLEHALDALSSLDDDELAAIDRAVLAPAQDSRAKSMSVSREQGLHPARSNRISHVRRRRPSLHYMTNSGLHIYVGSSAEENHHLTFHIARGNDLWFHARDFPGAHVVLWLTHRSTEPDQESLLDAAMLAKHHSDARREEQCDVRWTHVKHLQPGRRPGEVYVSWEKTLRVRSNPERLKRLLASRRAGSTAELLVAKLDSTVAGRSDAPASKKGPRS